jgi:ABC-2 type transport system permease protein
VASGHPHATGAEQVVPGEAVMNGFYIVGMTSFAFFGEHGWNTWDRLRASNATALEIIVGKGVPRFVLSLAQFAVIFSIGIPLLHLHIGGTGAALVPLVAAFAVCLVSLGVVTTAVCRTVQQANAFCFGGLVLFGAIGGALVPINALPGWARFVGPVTPTYWAMRGFQSVILKRGGFGAVVAPVLVLLAMSAVCGVLSIVRFRTEDAKTAWA